MRTFLTIAAVLALSASSALAKAPTCRDNHGKFTKCPVAAAPAKHCRDAKGKFAKCGTPGAVPSK